METRRRSETPSAVRKREGDIQLQSRVQIFRQNTSNTHTHTHSRLRFALDALSFSVCVAIAPVPVRQQAGLAPTVSIPRQSQLYGPFFLRTEPLAEQKQMCAPSPLFLHLGSASSPLQIPSHSLKKLEFQQKQMEQLLQPLFLAATSLPRAEKPGETRCVL